MKRSKQEFHRLLYRSAWLVAIVLGCIIIARGTALLLESPGAGEIKWWMKTMQNRIQTAVFEQQFPILTYEASDENDGISFGEYLSKLTFRTIPILAYMDDQEEGSSQIPSDPSYSEYLTEKEFKETYSYLLAERVSEGEVPEHELVKTEEEIDAAQQLATAKSPQVQEAVNPNVAKTGVEYSMDKLGDFDFLLNNFYSVHSSTTVNGSLLDASKLLAKDMKISGDNSKPQILVYHTHSQEEYTDFAAGNKDATIVGVGTYLTQLLTEQYGFSVIHDTSVYDLVDGKLDRNVAYSHALEGITKILEENPSIEVVIDLHRDGVREDLHLVTDVNGKPTAKIMLFNGISQTVQGPIEYLQNPYREDNLGFSLQLQLKAAAYYPNYTRKIYLKGLRYNQHLRARSILVEVGAQTNSYGEALNAMEPLADMLYRVLLGQ